MHDIDYLIDLAGAEYERGYEDGREGLREEILDILRNRNLNRPGKLMKISYLVSHFTEDDA